MTHTHSFDKDRIQVLLLENIADAAVNVFQQCGYHKIERRTTAIDTLLDDPILNDVRILGIRSRSSLTPDVLARMPSLKAVGCFCIGTNQVDLDAAAARAIPVFNAPFANTRSVAELVLGEIILLLRRIPQKQFALRAGKWQKSVTGAHETRGKTLGIIGYGRIGSQLSVLAEGLGMRVIFYDIEKKLPLGNATQAEHLEDLLASVDVVSCHVPETPLTANMINATRIAQMQTGAILINASRGSVVDIDALNNALEKEQLAGAAIDVFPSEPTSASEPFESPLRNRDNVILTPHIGGSTLEAQYNIGIDVAEKLTRYSDNGSTFSAVNFPEVNLPAHEGTTRILHIHQNKPGVMMAVNELFASQHVNIAAQYLQTSPTIGYVVMDIDENREKASALIDDLNKINGTLQSRVLF